MRSPLDTSAAQRATAILVSTLKRHSQLSSADERAISEIRPLTSSVPRGKDLVRQGDRPEDSILLLSGTLARYHTLANGMRQYLQLHPAGDLPDLQSLFLQIMDHSLASIEPAEIAFLPHGELRRLILKAPQVGFALWRHTLIDAAILRQAITNQGLRPSTERLAHFLCERYTLVRAMGLADVGTCSLPLNQQQIGQFIGLSIVSVNRAAQRLRKDRCAEIAAGKLTVLNWKRLSARAAFDPMYLHLDLHAPHMRLAGGRLEQE